jgi:hypothetical protein
MQWQVHHHKCLEHHYLLAPCPHHRDPHHPH